ncbi:MAG: sodium:calcium antiporter, partial [Bacteroidota bacterium]|nr:sodium:calcium antiporter [Bacteroidota bacterium]
IMIQIIMALSLIVFGAHLFVEKVQIISHQLGISPLILSLIIAPIATELPEKFNSIIWLIKGKDTLALGNITGAMVFQSSLIPAIGILFTNWHLTSSALITVFLTFLSTGLVYLQIRWKKTLTPITLYVGGVCYLLFVMLVLLGKI